MSKNTDLSELINYVKGISSGRLTFPFYTSSTAFTGTIAGYLGFDASGNILTSAGASQWTTSGSNIYFNTGNVGIGTSSPTQILDINSSSSTDTDLKYNLVIRSSDAYTTTPQSGIAFATFFNGSQNLPLVGIYGGKENSTINDFAGKLSFATRANGGNITERMRITSSGQILVGTTSNAFGSGWNGITLGATTGFADGYGNTRLYNNAYHNGSNDVYMTTGAAGVYTSVGGAHIWYNAPSGTGGTAASFSERMRITSTGQVLINTTTSAIGWTPGTPGINSKTPFMIKCAVLDTNIDTGAIIVGRTYPVANTSFTALWFQDSYANTIPGYITCYANSTVFGTSSDYRMKTDNREFNGLSILSQFKMYDFKWKNSDERQYGAFAHELQEVLPYAVTGVKDGDMTQSVDYAKLVPILVKSIQELKTELDQLKANI